MRGNTRMMKLVWLPCGGTDKANERLLVDSVSSEKKGVWRMARD